MIADLGTKALTVQRTKELKELMMMISQEECEGKTKEEGPEAVRPKEEKTKEEGPEAVSMKERDCEKGERCPTPISGNALQLAVMMAILSKAKAQGERDDEPLKYFMMIYTVLVILATLFLRRLMVWLPGADQAGGPEPCPPAPEPPRFFSSESSSQGSSLTVDNQGREVNRHSMRSKGKRKGGGKGKEKGKSEGETSSSSSTSLSDPAYGPAEPMTREQQIQFAEANRSWLMNWMASLSIEERRQAGILASSSIQEEPESQQSRPPQRLKRLKWRRPSTTRQSGTIATCELMNLGSRRSRSPHKRLQRHSRKPFKLPSLHQAMMTRELEGWASTSPSVARNIMCSGSVKP